MTDGRQGAETGGEKEMTAYDYSITTAYHRTDPENVESILKYGLLASKAGRGRETFKCIYLSTMPETCFGEVLFEVDIRGVELNPLSEWQLVSWNDIPPERIKLVS